MNNPYYGFKQQGNFLYGRYLVMNLDCDGSSLIGIVSSMFLQWFISSCRYTYTIEVKQIPYSLNILMVKIFVDSWLSVFL